ncbi:Coatomer subunit beta' [Rhizophlyctis rosea]|nr:Coatomer subunit beta' [Rhizophlyctis rosea]
MLSFDGESAGRCYKFGAEFNKEVDPEASKINYRNHKSYKRREDVYALTYPFFPSAPFVPFPGTIRIWHANTYRSENTLDFGRESVWAVSYLRGSNDVAFGYDDSTIAIKEGQKIPKRTIGHGILTGVTARSAGTSGLDGQQWKYRLGPSQRDSTANVKASLNDDVNWGADTVAQQGVGKCEVYPQTLQDSPNVSPLSAEIENSLSYTALVGRYDIREFTTKVKVFKSFKEKTNVNIRTSYGAEGIFGGVLMGVRSSAFLKFYDWDTGVCVMRVDVVAKNIYWSESDLVAIQQYLDTYGAGDIGEEGIEEAFEFIREISEYRVKTDCWTATLGHFDINMYLLEYIPRDNRVYLADKDLAVFSCPFHFSLIEYQIATLRGDWLRRRDKISENVLGEHGPASDIGRLADLKEQALAVSTDSEHRFDLAIGLNKLEVALEIAKEVGREDRKHCLTDISQFDLAGECVKHAKDLEDLLMY